MRACARFLIFFRGAFVTFVCLSDLQVHIVRTSPHLRAPDTPCGLHQDTPCGVTPRWKVFILPKASEGHIFRIIDWNRHFHCDLRGGGSGPLSGPTFWSGPEAPDPLAPATPIFPPKSGIILKSIKIMISHHSSIDNSLLSYHKKCQPVWPKCGFYGQKPQKNHKNGVTFLKITQKLFEQPPWIFIQASEGWVPKDAGSGILI